MKLFAALATVLLSVPAVAYESGSFIFRSGAATVSPDVSSSSLSLAGAALPGTAADVENGSALGLTGTYMLSDSIGVEVLAATPFSHDLSIKGLGESLDLGSTRHLPPTLLLQWYPRQASASIQPYFGLGVNYTVFFDEKIDAAADELFASLGASGGADLSLKSSLGLAAEAGVDVAFGPDQRWLFNLAVWWMDIDTEAKVSVPGVGRIAADVDIDPLVTTAGIGYRF